jgi:hypothetical protein
MVIDDKAIAISALTDAVETIERVLGITPYGVYSDVRVRLDILESRINNPNVPTPTVTNPFYIDGYGGVSISVGDGYPSESRNNGSLYLRRDGYTYEGVYAMRNGSWTLLPTDSWLAGGDLSGDYYSQTVIGMQGRAISSTTPTDGYNLTWNDGYSYWEPQIGFIASQDLSGTKTQQTVIGIQGNLISSDTPSDGYALVWNALESNWKPTALHTHFGTTIIPVNSGAYVAIDGNYDGYLMPDFTLNDSELPIYLVNCSGTLQDFRINLDTAPGSGENIVFMVRKNNIDTGITITINDINTSGCDVVNNVAVVPGDLISIRVITSNNAAPANVISVLNIVIL